MNHREPLSVKRAFASWLAAILYYGGVLRALKWFRRGRVAVILNYHRILDPNEEGRILSAMYVHPKAFETHLRYLAAEYQVVTMKDLLTWHNNPTSTARPLCAITFDDGWEDNHRYALPLLKKYNLPATLFISTDFIGSRRTPWFYRLGTVLRAYAFTSEERAIELLANEGKDWSEPLRGWLGRPAEQRHGKIEEVIEALKQLPAGELEQLAETLSNTRSRYSDSVNTNGQDMLDWQQVKDMKACGVEVGSHGVTHRILTRVPSSELMEEILESKNLIERSLGASIQGFSYPNGDFSEEVEEVVMKAGYRYACTIRPGFVTPHDNPFRLNRLLVHSDNTYSTALFACHLAGLFNRGRR
jgi:peptidoglycan/xylan/chitin deacetylase (PgdA/CDA1 family)